MRLGSGEPRRSIRAGQSAAQLAINLVGIVVVGVLVLWVRRVANRRQQAAARSV